MTTTITVKLYKGEKVRKCKSCGEAIGITATDNPGRFLRYIIVKKSGLALRNQQFNICDECFEKGSD